MEWMSPRLREVLKLAEERTREALKSYEEAKAARPRKESADKKKGWEAPNPETEDLCQVSPGQIGGHKFSLGMIHRIFARMRCPEFVLAHERSRSGTQAICSGFLLISTCDPRELTSPIDARARQDDNGATSSSATSRMLCTKEAPEIYKEMAPALREEMDQRRGHHHVLLKSKLPGFSPLLCPRACMLPGPFGPWQQCETHWKMRSQGLEPDAFTYVAILGACSVRILCDNGKHIHKSHT
ncbi:hypothetical protein SELMODRAFT_437247 [Selaginella moellendorffii]|uniref:Uncharacterized protein n=1 Tax=Selaginella moellendorffii TaxID=88036 RepID=D8QPM0_SELML|nr:hypothetical protein SELMODRAFT_437247 [Selaginella moellendorffii]